jgi:isopropylmalate/homocitrate/citramalate synthase
MRQSQAQKGSDICRNKYMTPIGIISFTDSTLRDGEQCRVAEIPTGERIKVFDQIVSTGIDIIEVGHGGNNTDWDLVKALIKHIRENPDRHKGVKIQILFGSQEEILTTRAEELLDLITEEEKKKFVFHVYDREDQYLRGLATEEYSREESAKRVADCVNLARRYGFMNFSISGEGATGSTPEEAARFYSTVIEQVFRHKSEEVEYFNVNLANTYGKTMGKDTAWDRSGTKRFVQLVRRAAKSVGREEPISLSVHSHNDYGTATSSSIFALESGFDRVEGTMFGTGERLGNAALCDVMLCLTERIRESIQNNLQVFKERVVCKELVRNIGNWHGACEAIVNLYADPHTRVSGALEFIAERIFKLSLAPSEAKKRFDITAFGNSRAFEAGSGPHDHGTKGHFESPNKTPGWQQYLYSALARSIMGDTRAKRVLDFDPELAKEITIGKHTGGGSTSKIRAGEILFATKQEYSSARRVAQDLIAMVIAKMSGS